MKIAFCHHLSMGYNAGGEQEIAQVARKLIERGHNVKIYALPFTFGGRNLVDPGGLLDGIPYEEGWFHDIECDVAYITYSPLCLASFRTKSPKVAGFHSQVWFRRPTLSYGLVPLLAKLVYDTIGRPELSQFDAVHLHDVYLVKAFRFLQKPAFFIPHPVDLDKFRPRTVKDTEFTVLYCGRPDWAKGFDEFLRLAEEMNDEGIRFVWLGGNTHYRSVTSLGFVSDPQRVAELIGRAHVVVTPQRVDSVGRSTLEALAVGTPVILRASSVSVPHLQSLILAQTRDEFKLRILELKSLWETGEYSKRSTGLEVLPERFSIEKVACAYEEMFASLL